MAVVFMLNSELGKIEGRTMNFRKQLDNKDQ